MSRFNHVPVKLPKLETTTKNRKRFYITPQDRVYPSITTVLSIRKKEGLIKSNAPTGFLDKDQLKATVSLDEKINQYRPLFLE